LDDVVAKSPKRRSEEKSALEMEGKPLNPRDSARWSRLKNAEIASIKVDAAKILVFAVKGSDGRLECGAESLVGYGVPLANIAATMREQGIDPKIILHFLKAHVEKNPEQAALGALETLIGVGALSAVRRAIRAEKDLDVMACPLGPDWSGAMVALLWYEGDNLAAIRVYTHRASGLSALRAADYNQDNRITWPSKVNQAFAQLDIAFEIKGPRTTRTVSEMSDPKFIDPLTVISAWRFLETAMDLQAYADLVSALSDEAPSVWSEFVRRHLVTLGILSKTAADARHSEFLRVAA
jgi:hypothetical protein